MPEMAARYVLNMGKTENVHPMTQTPMEKIVLDYFTGYASDPYHALERVARLPSSRAMLAVVWFYATTITAQVK